MNIAILGVGNIGGTLGKKWTQTGHPVIFGTRDTNSAKAQTLRSAFPSAHIDTVANALKKTEVILLSTPYAVVGEIVRANAEAFANKIVVDATNSFGTPVVNNLKTILDAVPTARVYRAFNSLGWEVFEQAHANTHPIDHFYCGQDDDARSVVEKLIAQIGLRPIWVGGNESIGIVDMLGSLWVTLVFQRGYRRNIAFKLVE